MEENKDRDEGPKAKLITGLEQDEDKPGIEHRSMQDQADTKHIEERDQMTENDFATDDLTDQLKTAINPDKTNNYKQDAIEESLKTKMYTQEAMEEKKYRNDGPKSKLITGPVLIEEKRASNHQSCQGRDDKLHIEESDENKCQSREEYSTGCSTNEDKTECDADKTKLETKNVGADRKTLYDKSEPNLIPARHEHNNKSNPEIDNRLQVCLVLASRKDFTVVMNYFQPWRIEKSLSRPVNTCQLVILCVCVL